MARYQSHTGQGGKSLNDRELSAKVRTKALNDIYDVLNDKDTKGWSDYKKTILANLSKSILPRLNEHTGEDGKAIEIKGVEINVRK